MVFFTPSTSYNFRRASTQLIKSKSIDNLLAMDRGSFFHRSNSMTIKMIGNDKSKSEANGIVDSEKEPTAFEKVASTGLAGVLAIACAEAIFWALGVPFAELWVKYTTGEWIDFSTTEGQLQAAGFSFGYGGFATVILQYRVTLFAIPLIPIMENLVVKPGKKFFGEKFGQKS
eukprot:gene8925-12035_t